MAELENIIETINWSIILPLIILSLLLTLIALIDCIRNEQTNGPKWLWVLIIVLIDIIGPVLYFVVGRKTQS